MYENRSNWAWSQVTWRNDWKRTFFLHLFVIFNAFYYSRAAGLGRGCLLPPRPRGYVPHRSHTWSHTILLPNVLFKSHGNSQDISHEHTWHACSKRFPPNLRIWRTKGTTNNLHLQDYREENSYVLGFFEEFLEKYVSSNSSYVVVSERHSREDPGTAKGVGLGGL